MISDFRSTGAPEHTGILNKRLLHVTIICLLGLMAYSNTFHVPFQWDEFRYIKDNPIVKDLGYFAEPSKAAGYPAYQALKSRYLGYLTFALDHKIHGLDVTGYHIVNLGIHLTNGILVYLLVILTFKTHYFRRHPSAASIRHETVKSAPGPEDLQLVNFTALFAALLFVLHPIQIEAVTYIFQRLASLVTLFYLLSVIFYVKGRLKSQDSNNVARGAWQKGKVRKFMAAGNAFPSIIYSVCSLLCAIFAMKTKENAFTLPFVIMLYEFLFFKGKGKQRLLRLSPFLLILPIIPLTLTGTDKPIDRIVSALAEIRGYNKIPKLDYLFTQFRVIVTYLRVLAFPVNQNFDYDYRLLQSVLAPQVISSFVLLLVIAVAGFYCLWRSRSQADLRLTAFGIFWFFITLSVESGIVPIPMVINEYRAYLPSVGFFIMISSGIFLFLKRTDWRRIRTALILLMGVVLLFSVATYKRNSVWGSRTELWKDTVSKSPYSASAHFTLGTVYDSAGMLDQAIEQFERAVELGPYDYPSYNNLAVACYAKGLTKKALKYLKISARLKPDYADTHYDLGMVYSDMGDFLNASKELKTALKLNPGDRQAMKLLRYVSRQQEEAVRSSQSSED